MACDIDFQQRETGVITCVEEMVMMTHMTGFPTNFFLNNCGLLFFFFCLFDLVFCWGFFLKYGDNLGKKQTTKQGNAMKQSVSICFLGIFTSLRH